ncbi:hypothetical protein BMBphi_gp021 [Bacillus phage vB_BthS_BMBphi]|nr:hypothetical protein BMBphi_gp021 [Bacillus phage vB_BthS_BMBphi]
MFKKEISALKLQKEQLLFLLEKRKIKYPEYMTRKKSICDQIFLAEAKQRGHESRLMEEN